MGRRQRKRDRATRISVVTVPMLDTGIGREAGFADDRDLVAHAQAERAKLDPDVRAMLDEIEERVTTALLYGREGGSTCSS